MKTLLTIGLAVAALTVSILTAVIGVFSIATGDLAWTVGLTAVAAATAWVAFALPTGRRELR